MQEFTTTEFNLFLQAILEQAANQPNSTVGIIDNNQMLLKAMEAAGFVAVYGKSNN